ncbi:immunity 26/phosphotriesterase HocA family protein [Bacteroides cellulosilyticus]|uniref:immunity 26/phosphotriesterase HocA family protein n=1 Tax=Bacteroides cellulosilyticus TaxID=246787 RepID=UPI0032EF23FB
MEVAIPFELTNEQRKYLGLVPVDESWELEYCAGQYFYYDGSIIRKLIISDDTGSYYECELCEYTEQNRTLLLPKTGKGKPKKMNYSATLSFRPMGVYFNFSSNNILIANYTTQTSFYQEENIRKLSLQEWLEKWISETTEMDLKEIECFKNAVRKHVKYREGDFFSFKIGRRKWGFGRIVLNISELRKSESFKRQKNYGLRYLAGKPLYIMIYCKISETPEIPIEELSDCATLHVQAIMDNNFYYGEYRIIGNKPVMPEEWEPVISYSRSISGNDPDTVYLQYGLIYKETTIDKFDKYLTDSSGCIDNPFRNEGIGFGIDDYSIIEDLITKNCTRRASGLNAPENIEIKREIFSFFGLDADQSYAENLRIVYENKDL